MQSNNPILTRVETYSDFQQPMTIQGAIQKSALLTVIAAVIGVLLFFYCFMTLNLSIAYAAAMVGAIGGFILGLKTGLGADAGVVLAPALVVDCAFAF